MRMMANLTIIIAICHTHLKKKNTSLVKVNENFFKTTSITSSHSSVIREKRESQNGGNKKTKPAKFSKKQLPPGTDMYVCVPGGRK